MSNRFNDMLADKAMDIVDKAMEENPTIPEEARTMLYEEEYQKLLEKAWEEE
jgi:hypothetical protein